MATRIKPNPPLGRIEKEGERRELRLTLFIAGEELSRPVSSWDELMALKEKVKPFAWFNKKKSRWEADGFIHNRGGVAKAIAEVFGVSFEEARRLVDKHNRMIIEYYTEKVRGTSKMVSLYSWLPSDVYYKVTAYAKKTGFTTYEFRPTKFVLAVGVAREEEYRRRLEEWLDFLATQGFIFDREAILGMMPEILEIAGELGRIKASITHSESKYGRRIWVRLEFNRKINTWDLVNWIIEQSAFKYNYQVFEAGNPQLKSVTIRGAFREKGEKNTVYVAGWFYQYAKEFLEDKGFKIDESNLPVPSTERVLDVESIIDKLRPYQKKALDAWVSNRYRGTIAMPTGAGKTWVGLAAISLLKVRTVIFVPTINLAHQWKEKIVKTLGVKPGDVGILGGGYKEIGKPILVALYDSGVKYSDKLGTMYAFYIFDEGHHIAASSFKEIAWNMLAPFRMVLSATIERDDENEGMIFKMAGEKVYSIDYDALVKKGFLAPVEVSIVGVELPPKEREKYYELISNLAKVKAEIKSLYASVAGIAVSQGYSGPGEYLRKTGDPEYKKLNKEAMSIRARIRSLEAGNSNKVKLAVEMAEKLIEKGRKTFIFTNLIKQAEEIFKKLSEKYPDRVAIVTGKTSAKERERIFREFRDGSIQVIVTTTVLDEGIDAPASDAAIVVSSRAIVHPRQFIQRIGRIVRPMSGKQASVVILRTKIHGGVEAKTIPKLAKALAEIYGSENIYVERSDAWFKRHGF